jgi:hypothetical protein
LLDDLLGNSREEPAVLGFAEQAFSLHSSGAIIAPRLYQVLKDLLGLGEAALALLRKAQLPVDDYVELALGAFDGLGLVLRPRVDLGRETRSPAVIAVSDGAVEDLDLHSASLPKRPVRRSCEAGVDLSICAITEVEGSVARRGVAAITGEAR